MLDINSSCVVSPVHSTMAPLSSNACTLFEMIRALIVCKLMRNGRFSLMRTLQKLYLITETACSTQLSLLSCCQLDIKRRSRPATFALNVGAASCCTALFSCNWVFLLSSLGLLFLEWTYHRASKERHLILLATHGSGFKWCLDKGLTGFIGRTKNLLRCT